MSASRELLEAVGTAARDNAELPATKRYATRTTPRKRRRDNLAEEIAQSADRLRAAADEVRPREEQLALQLKQEAQRLYAHAHWAEKQAKRRAREKRIRDELERERQWREVKRQDPTGVTPREKPEPRPWWET